MMLARPAVQRGHQVEVLDAWSGDEDTEPVTLDVSLSQAEWLRAHLDYARWATEKMEKMDSTDLIRYLLRRYPQENQKEAVKSFLPPDVHR